jgi:hypothetical protein
MTPARTRLPFRVRPRLSLRLPSRGDDRGASLVLALAFLTCVGLVVGALLTFSSTAVMSARHTLEHARSSNDAAGGLEAAINAVRIGTFDNAAGDNCLGAGDTLTVADPQHDTIAVRCTPGPDSGVAGGLVQIGANNKPGWALLTLGTNAGEPGIGQSGNNLFWVRGKVQSNSTITIGGSACPLTPQPPVAGANCSELYQTAAAGPPVTAAGACNGRIVSTGAVTCNTGATAQDPGATGQPTAAAYAQPSVSGAPARTAPACSSGTASTVSLSPGLYTDSGPLNTLMSCTSKIIHFTPGTYFFDFRNGTPSDHVWKIDNKDTTVVGGTPSGWSTGAASKPAVTMPGSCVSPLTTQSVGTGVQFVFGGDSRFAVGPGNVELCGQWSASRPPITIYGAKQDDGTGGTGAGAGTVDVAASSSLTTPAFTNLANLTADDGTPATATFASPSKATTATLTANGFVPASAPPPGSTLTAAVLTVKHRIYTGGTGVTGLSYTVTPNPTSGGTSQAPVALSTTPSATWRTSTSDLRTALAASVAAGTFSGLRVAVDATGAKNSAATVAVDWMQLDLTWTPPPALRAQSTSVSGAPNCVGTAPYVPGSQNCALITTVGNQLQFYITGTVYAPLAALDIGLTNTSGQVFRSGLIARSVRMGVSSSSSYSTPIIDVPDDTLGPGDLVVYLTAYRCPDGVSCTGVPVTSAPWVLVGKAKVRYDNGGVYPPVAGQRDVTVEAWQMLR